MTTNISVGEVLNRTVAIYRKRFALLVSLAAIVVIPAALIQGLLKDAGGMATGLASVVSLVASAVFAGAVVRVVQAEDSGADPGQVGAILSSIADRIWPLVWVGIVSGLAIGFGLVLLLVPGLFLLVIWSVFQPVIVVEGVSFDSLGRSRALVKGNGWNVFGLMVVVLALSLLAFALTALIGGIIGGWIGVAVVTAALGILFTPVDGLIRSILYFELAGHAGGGQTSPPPPQQQAPPQQPPPPALA